MSSSPPLVEIEVNIGKGKVRGELTPESEERLLENSPPGSGGQFTRSCSLPFSDLRESLPQAVAETMLKFDRELEEVGFSFSVLFLGKRITLLDGEDMKPLLKEELEPDMRSCPGCGRLYSKQVTVCPECGRNLCREGTADG